MTIPELQQAFKEKLSVIQEIKQLFINQFGEDKIDLQSKQLKESRFILWYEDTIDDMMIDEIKDPEKSIKLEDFFSEPFKFYVYWPEVTITNESGKSHLIKDLYAYIPVKVNGTLSYDTGFTLNRTTYTEAEWKSNYLHSHINGISVNSQEFLRPCLGNGPIKAAVSNLRTSFDKDWWEEFLFELDRYVYVESLAGVPYKKMSNIITTSEESYRDPITLSTPTFNDRIYRTHYSTFTKNLLKRFFREYLTTAQFEFNYNGFMYKHRILQNEFWLQVSNAFIEWVNCNYRSLQEISNCDIDLTMFIQNKILLPVVINNSKFLKVSNINSTNTACGRKVLVFKKTVKKLNIIPMDVLHQENTIYLLNREIVYKLYSILPQYINYYYGRTTTDEPDEC